MNIREKQIVFSDEEFMLTNSRAVYWKRKNILILSDLHLGKSAHFRKNGISLPVQTSWNDLQRLKHLMLHYQPKQVIIVGDLVHADANNEVFEFKKFTFLFPETEFILIKGNHDRLSPERLKSIGIHQIHHHLEYDGITFSHQPIYLNHQKCITGHIHPGVRIQMPAKGFLKLPCFWVSESMITLPAFSEFTGLDTRYLPKNSNCYAVSTEGIFEVHFRERKS